MRASSLAFTSVWGFVDQALISASNFSVMVLLARQLGPQDFGVFVLEYTALLFAASIQTAVITGPHNVLGAVRADSAYAQFTTSLAIGQGILSVTVIAVTMVAGLALQYSDSTVSGDVLILGPVIAAWQMQEFIRRVLYTQSDYLGAFSNDLAAYGGQILLLFTVSQSSNLSIRSALFTIGLSSGVGVLLGLSQLRPNILWYVDSGHLREDLIETWAYSRWLIGSSLSYWLSGQLYFLLAAGFVGAQGLGTLRALQNLLAPTHILLRTVDSALPSATARAFNATGLEGVVRLLRRTAVPGAAGMAVYCLSVAVCSMQLTKHVIGPQYQDYYWIIPFYSLVYFLEYLSVVAAVVLKGVGDTRSIMWSTTLSAAISLSAGVALVAWYGMAGVVAGLLIHGITVNVVLWWCVRSLARTSGDREDQRHQDSNP
jgi:O-antigen/teichoic acid export membrane protein